MVEDSTACFAGLVDPGVMRRCDHRLTDILMIAVSACAESWCRAVLLGCLANYCAMFRTSPEGCLPPRPGLPSPHFAGC